MEEKNITNKFDRYMKPYVYDMVRCIWLTKNSNVNGVKPGLHGLSWISIANIRRRTIMFDMCGLHTCLQTEQIGIYNF